MPDASFVLRDLAIVLTLAAVTTVVFQRLHQPVVVGYVLAGLIVGPGVLGLVGGVHEIETLAELGVILLMASLGLEFSLRRIVRLGPRVAVVTAVEVGLMFFLGYTAGQFLGFDGFDRLLAGGIVAISSTMIIARVFAETRPPASLRELVYGVLVMEDLVAILLIVLFTSLATGADLTAWHLFLEAGRLLLVLAVMLTVGLLVVPRAMRYTFKLRRPETTLVTAMGICFLFALLAREAGYSVALGAFLAGSLIHESGLSRQIDELIRPVRDMFSAIFFVAVGMLLVPGALAEHAVAIGVLVVVVVTGKVIGVTTGAFLTGHGLTMSVRAGMSMAQIGEFSFIIAGLGLTAAGGTGALYPVAVAVSVLTALMTPWLVRFAEPTAMALDRHLPKPLQTVVSLYGSWVELVRTVKPTSGQGARIRRIVIFLLVDVTVIAGLLIAPSAVEDGVLAALTTRTGFGIPWTRATLLIVGGVLAIPFGIGLVTSARRLAWVVAEAAMPAVAVGKVDQALAPRRTLVTAVELGILAALGLPLVAITQPFIPRYGGIVVLLALMMLLLIGFWRNARNLEGHAQAGAELIVSVLAKQGIATPTSETAAFATVEALLPGLGSLEPVRVSRESPAVGKSLRDLNLRGITGATVVALCRGEERHVLPAGREEIQEGDLLALSGSHEAVYAARRLLEGPSSS